MSDITIEEIVIPAGVESADAADFIAAVGVRNGAEALAYGTNELSRNPAESISYWQSPYAPVRTLVARLDGRVVGRGDYETRIGTDSDDAWPAAGVLPEYRGHRLGMLLKVGNLEQLHRMRPGHPSIITFNAEENRHMLSVNESLGFVPFVSEGAWKKLL